MARDWQHKGARQQSGRESYRARKSSEQGNVNLPRMAGTPRQENHARIHAPRLDLAWNDGGRAQLGTELHGVCSDQGGP